MSDTWLCVTAPDHQPLVKAVYDNEAQAEAWQEGVTAAYMRGYIFCLDSNEGSIDLDVLVKEADHA